jgi:UDP-2-acetamido-3-amino-2,3-dideoxy-glucuronate N-acetyltransferase
VGREGVRDEVSVREARRPFSGRGSWPPKSNDSALPPLEVQVGLVGLGNWGSNLARALQHTDGCRLRAICDTDAQRLAAAAVKDDVVRTLEPERLLADPRVDALVLATPTRTHAELTLRALLAGKHVFVEKPLALCLTDALSIDLAARQANRRVMVGHILQYHGAFLELSRLARDGALGRVRWIASERLAVSRPFREEAAWWTLAPHDLSLLELLLGSPLERYVIRCRGNGTQSLDSRTTSQVRLENGVHVQVDVGCEAPHKRRCVAMGGDLLTAVFEDRAADACIRLYSASSMAWGSDYDGRPPYALRKVSFEEPLRVEMRHFVQSLISGSPFRTDLASGIRIVQALEAGANSAKNQTSIRVGSTANRANRSDEPAAGSGALV